MHIENKLQHLIPEKMDLIPIKGLYFYQMYLTLTFLILFKDSTDTLWGTTVKQLKKDIQLIKLVSLLVMT